MPTLSPRVAALVAALALSATHQAGAQAQAAVRQSGKLRWGPAPAALPPGAKAAVVSGDPAASGPFVVALAFPNGYRVPPHFHPTDETVTVKSGSFWYGMGDRMDRKAMKEMKPGQSGTIPANTHHYAAARGRTVVEVSGKGPFVVNYVNPGDDPRKKMR